jgi:hypothetical protein
MPLGSPPKAFNAEEFYKNNFNTKLSQKELQQYNQWIKEQSISKKRDMSNDHMDYDMQGYWKNSRDSVDSSGRGHFPDTYKKPNHPTFSDQSIYHNTPSNKGFIYQGGKWSEDGSTYTPSETMLRNTHSKEWLQEYMKKREPNTRLILPTLLGE